MRNRNRNVGSERDTVFHCSLGVSLCGRLDPNRTVAKVKGQLSATGKNQPDPKLLRKHAQQVQGSSMR